MKLQVFYTGAGVRTEAVDVAAGQIVQRDVTMSAGGTPPGKVPTPGEVVRLDAFTVSSSKEMEGAAIAINEQRFARNNPYLTTFSWRDSGKHTTRH